MQYNIWINDIAQKQKDEHKKIKIMKDGYFYQFNSIWKLISTHQIIKRFFGGS